jgi:hypothetical protein
MDYIDISGIVIVVISVLILGSSMVWQNHTWTIIFAAGAFFTLGMCSWAPFAWNRRVKIELENEAKREAEVTAARAKQKEASQITDTEPAA